VRKVEMRFYFCTDKAQENILPKYIGPILLVIKYFRRKMRCFVQNTAIFQNLDQNIDFYEKRQLFSPIVEAKNF
jgi:hypothetical protein